MMVRNEKSPNDLMALKYKKAYKLRFGFGLSQ